MLDKIFFIFTLIIELAMLITYFILLINHKMKLSKANKWYLIPTSIVVFILYLYCYIKGDTFTILNIFDSISSTIKIFILDVKSAVVLPVMEESTLFSIVFLTAVCMASYAMYSSIVLFIIDRIRNNKRIKNTLNNEYNDILLISNICLLDNVRDYLVNNSNTILWIEEKITLEGTAEVCDNMRRSLKEVLCLSVENGI